MIKINRRNVGKNQMIYSHHTNRQRAGEHFRAWSMDLIKEQESKDLIK